MNIMVAKITNGKEVIGYRIMNMAKVGADGAVTDIKTADLVASMAKGAKVINLKVEKNEVKGTNGALDRYTSIDMSGKPVGGTPLVVLFRVKGGFMCANYAGASVIVKDTDAVSMAKKSGIANGKVVNRGGKDVISSIFGEYPEMPAEYQKKKDDIIIVSNEHSAEELFNRIVKAQKTKRIIGKLDADSTGRVVRYMSKKTGLFEAVEAKDTKKISEACDKALKFLEMLTRVGDRKAISEFAAGFKSVKSDKSKEDLFDRVVEVKEHKAVNFK